MAAETIARHPALRRLARRVRARWLLRVLRRGLPFALVGDALLSIVGRLSGLEAWPSIALAWLLLSLGAMLAVGVWRAPNEWTVARAADALGLAERVTSSLHARAIGAPVADLIEEDAHAALSGLDPSRLSIFEGPRAWAGVGLSLTALVLLVLTPLPRLGQSTDNVDAQRLAVAQQRVQAMQLQPPSDTSETQLQAREQQQLQALRDELARSTTSDQAAREIEQTQQQLAHLPGNDDYAARRSADAVAQALEDQPDNVLIPLAQALQAHDAQATQQALADLSNRLDTPGAMTDAERSNAQLALQSAANAASATQPNLAGALRRAAGAVGAKQAGALSDKDLQDLLSQDATNAAALDQLEQNVSDLGQLRATTLPANATLVAATGTPTAYALLRGTPPPNATPVGAGLTAGAPSGGGASPNGTTAYDPVYAPSHLGGDPGPQEQITGDASQARGASVDLPQGPVSTGDARPYDQVYAQYAQEARQSAARQSMPPNVQGLVDRYFGAIAPTPGAATP